MPKPAEPLYLYLTTTGRRSGQPREIEIWFTRRAGRYYVIAENGARAQWVQPLMANPPVRWRVAGRAVSGRARVVVAGAEAALNAAVQARSRQKYGWGEGLVIELTPDAQA